MAEVDAICLPKLSVESPCKGSDLILGVSVRKSSLTAEFQI